MNGTVFSFGEVFLSSLLLHSGKKEKGEMNFQQMKAQIFHFQFNQLNFAAFSKTYHGIDDR